jgi:hypothetical protein
MEIDRGARIAVPLARWGANYRSQKENEVFAREQLLYQTLIADVTPHKGETWVGKIMEQARLPVHKVIYGSDVCSLLQEVTDKDRSYIPCTASYQDFHFFFPLSIERFL